MLYYTANITHTIDMTQGTWQTSVSGNQVTVQHITSMVTPPFGPPKNNT